MASPTAAFVGGLGSVAVLALAAVDPARKEAEARARPVGYVGDFVSFILFLVPLIAFRKIKADESVGENSPFPYWAGFFNCAIWLMYGLHHSSAPVIIINSVGTLLQFGYVVGFLHYVDDEGVKHNLTVALVVEFIGLCVVASFGFGLWGETFGAVGVLSGMAMYVSPLDATYTAWKNTTTEGLDPYLSLGMLANSVVWVIYASIAQDGYVLAPNLVGLVSAVVQLGVYVNVKAQLP